MSVVWSKDMMRTVCNHSAQSWSKDSKTGQMYCDDCETPIVQNPQDGFWYRAEPKTGQNIKEPYKWVRHADLKRVSDDSRLRSWCPVCDRGILLVARVGLPDTRLSKIDRCTLCGQAFVYEDDEIDGQKLVPPNPSTLEETILALDELLSEEDRKFIQESKDPEGAVIGMHHSLGQAIRNKWGLWMGSPLARHMKEVHGVDHPDDMSGLILSKYARARFRTRWQRIASDDDEI